MATPKKRKQVLVIGSGFGGLNLVKGLKRADCDVLLVDKTNHHLFQPLLYQVASAALSPGDIAVPIRKIFYKQENVTVFMGNVVSIDLKEQFVTLSNGDTYDFDTLVIAIGSHHSYFGNDAWAPFAPGLKTVNDAVTIREKILLAFERAERSDDPEEQKAFLRFVLVGGGPTGVEMAGAIAEIAHDTLFHNFRRIKPEDSEIYLVEHADHLLPHFPVSLSERARRDLERMGVKVLTGKRVTAIDEGGVSIDGERLEAKNVIWAAGNQVPELLKTLDVPLNRAGQVIVDNDFSLPGFPNVFAIGDCAYFLGKDQKPLPGIAPSAIQAGHYVAKIIKNDVPKEKRKPFVYFDKGQIATIGKVKAVAHIGKLKLTGFIAWLLWSMIHIMYLVGFKNRLLVAMQWALWYLSGSRNIRLITRFHYKDDKEPFVSSHHISEHKLEGK